MVKTADTRFGVQEFITSPNKVRDFAVSFCLLYTHVYLGGLLIMNSFSIFEWDLYLRHINMGVSCGY